MLRERQHGQPPFPRDVAHGVAVVLEVEHLVMHAHDLDGGGGLDGGEDVFTDPALVACAEGARS